MYSTPFIGREHELHELTQLLSEARHGGILLAVRGRRRVGKSRLIEEWCRRNQLRYVFYESTRAREPGAELVAFAQEAARSTLAAAGTFAGVTPQSWEAAFMLIANQSTREAPSVVVLDEFPYLFEGENNIDAVIQTVWDRRIDKRASVLIILIGSDLHMMEQLGQYDRPLFGRVREMAIRPLSPAEIATMTNLPAQDAFDAYLVCGGFPMLAERWQRGETIWSYLERELTATSPLIVNGERMLAAEFPVEAQARAVLEAAGRGEVTFGAISQKTGINNAGVNRALDILRAKRMVETLRPLSAENSIRNTRYVLSDSYLRFWARFLGAEAIEEIERGRGDLVLAAIRDGWAQYRGIAIEPLIREALERMLPRAGLGTARYVGAYWTRKNDPQVDLVGTEKPENNSRVEFVGSIKWREDRRMDAADVAKLARDRLRVPGAGVATPMVGVSRAGFDEVRSLSLKLSPEDLLPYL